MHFSYIFFPFSMEAGEDCRVLQPWGWKAHRGRSEKERPRERKREIEDIDIFGAHSGVGSPPIRSIHDYIIRDESARRTGESLMVQGS